MPVAPDPVVADIRSIRIEPAPVIELFWVLHDLAGGKYHHEHPVFHDRDLAARARAMTVEGQGDCFSGFDELLILAGGSDLLTTPDVDALVRRIPSLAQQPEREYRMATETEDTRRATYARLTALRRSAKSRSALQQLLADTWDAIRETWDEEGRQAVEQTCAALRTRAADGADLTDLTTPHHLALEARFRPLVDAAIARGEALVVPCYFGGHSLVYDVPGVFVIGVTAHTMPRAQQLRLMVQASATRLKVLADPTRMAILAYLDECPSSVTELARTFSIAQPTVSAHIRMLREAHLVQSVNEASKVRYQVARDEVDTLLNKVRSGILGSS